MIQIQFSDDCIKNILSEEDLHNFHFFKSIQMNQGG